MRGGLIRTLLYLFSKLSLPTLHLLATGLGWLIFISPARSLKRITRTNIRLCFPQLSSSAQEILVKQSIIETCKAYSELGILWLWSVEHVLPLVKTVNGEHFLQEALQQGRGVILLTPHLGAWELAGLYASVHYPLTALYRPPKLADLNDFILKARQRAGGRYVPTNRRGVKALFQTLQQQAVVGILPDQVPTEAGIFAPFFGRPTYTMVLVSRLAQRGNVPVIFTYAERLSKGRGFHVHFLPAPPTISAPDLEKAVNALNQGIEQCIQRCPTQYQWSYKRFKRQPTHLPSIY